MTMKLSTRATVTLLAAVLGFSTTTIARADDSSTDSKPKKAVVTKAAAKKKKKPAKKAAAAPVTDESAANTATTDTLSGSTTAAKPEKPQTTAAAAEPPPAPVAKPASSNPWNNGADKPADARDATAAARDKPFSVAPLLGYGTDGLHMGVGLRAGYNFMHSSTGSAYVGASFVYHFGSSAESTVMGQSYGWSYSAFYPSVEGGYEIRPIDRLAIRPYGGVGVIFVSMSSTGLGGKEVAGASANSLAIYPGCSVTYDIPGSSMFVGGDARILIPFDSGGTSFGMFATGGMRF